MPEHTKNEIKAGALMVVGFILLCTGIYVIADFKTFFLPKNVQYFSFDKVEGLKVDDDVLYAGIKCGRVTHIEFQAMSNVPKGDSLTRILVTVEVNGNVPLTDKDKPSVSRGFTGNVYMDIDPWQRSSDSEPLATPLVTTREAPLRGYHYPSFDEIKMQAKTLLASFQGEFEKVSRTLSNIELASADAKKITGKVDEIVADAAPKFKDIVGKADKTVENAQTATAKLKDDMGAFMADAKDTMARAKDAVTNAQAKIEELLPKFTEIVDKINDSATNVKSASTDVKTTTVQVKEIVVANRPNIDGTIEELRQAAARLNLTMEDLRRNPWKLLNRNIEADAYTQNIYDASMSFAEGARALSQASATLQALTAQPGADPEKVKEATDRVNKLVKEMSNLQQLLYDAMKHRVK
jgi:ABC-type transporter Mla subunit MlaD